MAIVRSSIWRGVAVVYLPSLPATMKPVIADVVDVTGASKVIIISLPRGAISLTLGALYTCRGHSRGRVPGATVGVQLPACS